MPKNNNQNNNLGLLQQRARLLSYLRTFFAERLVLEVETPILSQAGNPDPNILSFTAQATKHSYYLHTSPEFAMKRLLAAGSGCIYQICKVFRADESGRYHNPEFTLLEWYRLGYDYQQLMAEVASLVNGVFQQFGHCVAPLPVTYLSYQQAFQQYAGIDPFHATAQTLQATAHAQGWQVTGLGDEVEPWLDVLMSHQIAPHLGQNQLTFIYDYPAPQAALARLKPDNPAVAERFELYYQGLELANGFRELTDAAQQRQRWLQQNQTRQQQHGPIMPLDENFLAALEQGLPECSGVALGLDRLLLLNNRAPQLADVLPFTIANA